MGWKQKGLLPGVGSKTEFQNMGGILVPPWAYMKFWLEDGVPEPVRGPGSEIGFLNTRPRRRIHPNAGHPI